ncbi:GIY-YIG nuclease family protein [Pseudomonas sp. B21-028]|uniref:GIY-YIG nuclease family protein n=1 Tax=Pseudomonas sp. B21-028 TaxID=2895480 RepID=UPI00215F1C8D|nr:GIY-YIG nuclease family protein [Pseudomonas sp. B21-028]UVL81871.1 GIY-YIG nuclease family protein [Pseudomonas sp. B21-028]
MASHVYILRDLKHPRFKIGKANNILARARSFRWESIDFPQSLGLRLASETDAYILEKILHRTFRLASVDPLAVVASGGSADGASEWFSTSCWPRLLQYLKDNQDLHPHETVSGWELAALIERQLEPSQTMISREQLKKEKEARRIEREVEFIAYRRTQLEGLRASLKVVHPKIAQELERLKLNGNIAGVCDTSMGSYLVLADTVPLPSGGLLWGLKPLSTHYDYPGGGGSIMSSFSQITCGEGTISKVELPRAYLHDDLGSETDEIIYEVFLEEFELFNQLQSIPEGWISAIFPPGRFLTPSSDGHESERAIGKVMDALSRSGCR